MRSRNYVTEKRYNDLDHSHRTPIYENTIPSTYNFSGLNKQFRLSEAERKVTNSLNNPYLNELVEEGDNAYSNGDIITEAIAHRDVQERLKDIKKNQKDDMSLEAYTYNSVIVHNRGVVKKALGCY